MLNTYLETTKKLAANSTIRMIFIIFLLTVIFYYSTWASLVSIWTRSETFAHGYIVIPVSLWLIWQNKAIHPYLFPGKPSGWGLLFLLANGFLWLLASLINALVIQQYALVGILIGAIWFYLGNKTSKQLIFPLAFLYFMVPVGEALIPYLIDFTADFTIYLLRKTGLSVYREGTHFSLVSGDWSVVEACSGLRYLLASFTLGTIYAYITYQKLYKRVLFMLFSLILPIIANGLRAYMIVMIGHLSGMKLAVGVDHLIYGAIFFALIIFIMFYIGSFWKDNSEKTPPLSIKQTETPSNSYINISVLFLCFAIWPLTNHWLQAHYHADTSLPNWPPLTENPNWHEIQPPAWPWHPKFEQTVNDSTRYFQHKKNGSISGFYQANFGDEKQGSELVSSRNVLRRYNKNSQLNERKLWHILYPINVKLSSSSNPTPSTYYSISILRNNTKPVDFIVIHWYQLGDFLTNNPYIAKTYQVYKRITKNNAPEINNILFFKVEPLKKITQKNILSLIKNHTPFSPEEEL